MYTIYECCFWFYVVFVVVCNQRLAPETPNPSTRRNFTNATTINSSVQHDPVTNVAFFCNRFLVKKQIPLKIVYINLYNYIFND